MFSLPGSEPVGTIAGGDTWRFLDLLAGAGFSFWQILPVPPGGHAECPYSGTSAYAVEPILLSLEQLAEDGYLSGEEWAQARAAMPAPERADRVPWKALRAWKEPLLARAARAVPAAELDAWLDREGWWARDWALWWAISQARREPWHRWPAPLRDRDPVALQDATRAHARGFRHAAALQCLVDGQWARLRRELHQRGMRLMGDLPLYVAGEGADCWAHRPLFQLAADGTAQLVAGAPPDAFTQDGQRWDNPVYDWEHSASTGHAWWRARFRRLMAQVDEIRVDHFRGFVGYFSFPFQQSPRDGHWSPGPGRGLFDALAGELSELRGEPVGPSQLPVVVEDLGFIDDDVVRLRDTLGFPGTKVLQFGFDGDPNNPHHPAHYPGPNCVACTGTHDTQTAAGWYQTAPHWVHHHFHAAIRHHGESPARSLVRLAQESRADHAVVPLQDILDLGDEARVNVPGTVEGNWEWRAPWPHSEALGWIRELHASSGRLPLARTPGTS